MNRIIKQLLKKRNGLECLFCNEDKNASEVLTLPCEHVFCLMCLGEYVTENLSVSVACPVEDCSETISDSQIRDILSTENINKYESLMTESIVKKNHCLIPECNFMIEFEDKNTQYDCPICSLYNCIACQAAHRNFTCEKYKKMSPDESKKITDAEINRARNLLLKRQAEESRKSIVAANNVDLAVNQELFECFLCCLIIKKGEGVRLRNCFHLVCRECLYNYLKTIDKFPPKCPEAYCTMSIEDREIKKLLNENDYELYMRKSLNRVKPKLVNSYQCQTPNCDFFCELYDKNLKTLKCPKCKVENCLSCKAVHPKEKCKDYQTRIESTDIGKSRKFVEDQIKEGKCMRCPDCQNLVQKVRGCNWIQCSNCGVELCWILQMHRWGPKGRGDTSGGCKCMVNDKYCHPDCGGCIPHEEGECQIM